MPTTPTEPTDRAGSTSTPFLQDELDELERRFVGHDDDELMMRLKETVVAHITRALHDQER